MQPLAASTAERPRPTAGEPLVRLTRVLKTYANGATALSNVSFSVQQGEFVSLVGPSGCGKSTILRLVAGLGEATAGEVLVDGSAPEMARQRGGDIAFVFQEATLLPWRTVVDNVALALELDRVPRADRQARAREALSLVDLQRFEQTFPRQLSGGMRMRVSIARALVTRPKLLLMDEPFGALDEMTRQHLQNELLRLCDLTGWTVLFVTHNMFEAVFLSTRILTMSSHPGTITGEIRVPVPRPRTADFRSSHEFSELVHQVTQSLREG